MDYCQHDYKLDCECELSEAQREREAGVWIEGMQEGYENVLDELLDFHLEKGQVKHLEKRSNVCGTCRIIEIVERLDDELR